MKEACLTLPTRPPSKETRDVASWREDPQWKAAADAMTAQDLLGGRETTVVNCWNLNSSEDPQMWERYTRDEYGVVVKSTLGRLRRVMPATPLPLVIDKVQYVDFRTHNMPLNEAGSAIVRAFLKRPEYAFEHELRVATMNIVAPYTFNPDGTPMTAAQAAGPGQFEPGRPGLYLKVDIRILIRSVVVAPKSPKWLLTMVLNMLRNHGPRCIRSKIKILRFCLIGHAERYKL